VRIQRTRTRTNTYPNGTEANAAGRSGNARALRKQSKCRGALAYIYINIYST